MPGPTCLISRRTSPLHDTMGCLHVALWTAAMMNWDLGFLDMQSNGQNLP